ncbi:MAG: hypothetical protein ACRDGF_03805 [Chloroflexota bacterium]
MSDNGAPTQLSWKERAIHAWHEEVLRQDLDNLLDGATPAESPSTAPQGEGPSFSLNGVRYVYSRGGTTAEVPCPRCKTIRRIFPVNSRTIPERLRDIPCDACQGK